MDSSTQVHWENLYAHKQSHEMSWTQPVPTTSLQFIDACQLPHEAPIIDVGGGDSRLVDHLLAAGYRNLTVLDISAAALARAQQRLGEQAQHVRWLVADVREFVPPMRYALWHDRAAFHFLTTAPEIARYLDLARTAVMPEGFMTLGTFSLAGPTRCSGLPIRQYSEATLTAELRTGFRKLHCLTEDHQTPFQTTQNFLYCFFQRQAAIVV
jgi:hypothetical protein